MYALLYTIIECVNKLTIQTIYMVNVSICLTYALHCCARQSYV